MLVPETAADGAAIFAERVAIEAAATELQGQEVRATASIGFSERRQEELEIDPLLRRADTALYTVKSASRNCVRSFEPNRA